MRRCSHDSRNFIPAISILAGFGTAVRADKAAALTVCENFSMNNLVGLLVAVVITLFFIWRYMKNEQKRDELARESAKKGELRSDGPQSQHPRIDKNECIGCATCTTVCPEGDVLAMLGGQAVIVNG